MYSYEESKDEDEGVLPREKLEAQGTGSLSDTLLVKLMLGVCNENSRNLALISDVCRILSQTDDPDRLFSALKSVKGIKIAKASGIIAGFELFRRKHMMKMKVKEPRDCYNALKLYSNETQEHFIMIDLNAACEIISTSVISIGLANQTIIHPRELFSRAIEVRAVRIVIAHNHPSGDVLPSQNDIRTTRRLAKAGEIIGIRIMDHIIFANESFFSFAEHSILDFQK